jgi:hypothetical protein
MTMNKNLNVVRPFVLEKCLKTVLIRTYQSVKRTQTQTQTQTHLNFERQKTSLFNRKSGMTKLKKG